MVKRENKPKGASKNDAKRKDGRGTKNLLHGKAKSYNKAIVQGDKRGKDTIQTKGGNRFKQGTPKRSTSAKARLEQW